MKNILSVFLAFLMLCAAPISAFAMSNAKFDWEPASNDFKPIPRDDNVIVRIAMGSDVHIGDVSATPKLENAYKVIGKLGGADAFVLVGDLTDNGREAQYDELMRIVSENSKNLTVDVDGFTLKGAGAAAPVGTTILTMGNHEYFDANVKTSQERFVSKTGQDLDKLYWIAGKVPVIKVGMINGAYKDNYVTKHDFIKNSLDEIDATGYKGHIFIATHIATGGTVVGSPGANDEPFAKETVELMAKYPQIIHVSGHSHQQINNPTFIDQSAGFTSITDGVVGEDYSPVENEYFGSGIILFDIKSDGKTKVHRIDLENGEILYSHEQWILDASDTAENFIYFSNKSNATNPNYYGSNSKAPSFPENSWAKFKINDDHDSIDVTFTSNAISASEYNYDYVRRYRVRAKPADGEGTTVTAYIVNDSYKHKDNRVGTMTVTLGGLDWNEDYVVTVQAQTSYGDTSNAITAEGYANVGIPEFSKVKLLYDVDYSYGNMKDAMGHAETLSRIAKAVYDEEIGQYAANLSAYQTNRYEFGQDELEAIRKELTLETYFKLANNTDQQTIVGMYFSAGLGLEVSSGALRARLHTVNGSTDLSEPIPVEAGEWIHALITYEGKDMKVYINGELVLTDRRTGGLNADISAETNENAFLIHVGGRAATGSETYNLARGSLINCFRLYSGRMTAEEVKAAYERTTKANVTLPFTDVAEDAWYADTVRYAYENELMNGTSDTAFAPATATSRAMIVQLLYNMEGRPAVEYKPVFTDVKEDAWYADAVIWAYENGVTTGSSATTFSPDALVTREQVAVFLYRFMKDYKGEEMAEGADISAFPDSGKISPYAGFAEAVAWANGVGIITGKTSSGGAILAPLDNAQRCESATMFARFHRSFVA